MPALKKQSTKKLAPHKAANPVRPAKGTADYKAMREELVSAFPETLARLAK